MRLQRSDLFAAYLKKLAQWFWLGNRYLFILLVATSLAGCVSPQQPTRQERSDSSKRGASAFVGHLADSERASFALFASDSPASMTFFIHDRNSLFQIEKSRLVLGLATGITHDGYLMTAAHTAKRHCVVLGFMDGSLKPAKARVVYKKSLPSFGEEFAILHVENRIDRPLRLGDLHSEQNQVRAFACDRGVRGRMIVLSGQIVKRSKGGADRGISKVWTDLPAWHGDSGGALMTPDGDLVGVITGAFRPWFSHKTLGVACVPGKELIQSIIVADRLNSKKTPRIVSP
jgi:Trypsin-like peptidase domain